MTQTAVKTTPFTLGELMVAAAAREIRDGDVCFVGMRLPLIAFVVAKRTHAPNAVGLFENGVIRSTPALELIYTMADPPNILGATQCLDMLGVMSLLQSGRVNLGFLGAAEMDRFGNLNSTQIGPTTDDRRPTTRLPGSGGACDIASLAQRFICLLEHAKHRLPERVSYLTSPGNGDGGDWRSRVGLPRGGACACITNKCVLRFRTPDDPVWTRAASPAQVFDRRDREGRGATREGHGATREGHGATREGHGAAREEHGAAREERGFYRADQRDLKGHGFSRADWPKKMSGALAPEVRVEPEIGEAYLASLHPGVNIDDVLANTGWNLKLSPDLAETPAPTPGELAAIRDYDREGFWSG